MIKRLLWWLLFVVALLVAWRLAGILMDFAMLVVICLALAFCRLCPRKTSK